MGEDSLFELGMRNSTLKGRKNFQHWAHSLEIALCTIDRELVDIMKGSKPPVDEQILIDESMIREDLADDYFISIDRVSDNMMKHEINRIKDQNKKLDHWLELDAKLLVYINTTLDKTLLPSISEIHSGQELFQYLQKTYGLLTIGDINRMLAKVMNITFKDGANAELFVNRWDTDMANLEQAIRPATIPELLKLSLFMNAATKNRSGLSWYRTYQSDTKTQLKDAQLSFVHHFSMLPGGRAAAGAN